jgi:response regulator RpfG family c-di-GMP phosphodiesterase
VTTSVLPRILCVDDEPNVLDGLRRSLRGHFAVETGVGGAAGLERLRAAGPFSVIVSDYQMPHMNGAEFLAAARRKAPGTTRVLLTGQADLTSAAQTVNEGQIFRLLLKPVDRDELVTALAQAVEHHQLKKVERELLEHTLRGSVRALTEVLSLACPAAFARGERIGRLATQLADEVGADSWQVEIAARLSQLGAITLPPEVLDRLGSGQELDAAARAMVDGLPALVDQVLGGIPRLETVREAILRQGEAFDPAHPVDEATFAARVLRLVGDYDWLEAHGTPAADVVQTLAARVGCYDPALIEALGRVIRHRHELCVASIEIADLAPGMVLADHLLTGAGVKLVPKGHDLTPGLLQRIRNFAAIPPGVIGPARVFAGARTETS